MSLKEKVKETLVTKPLEKLIDWVLNSLALLVLINIGWFRHYILEKVPAWLILIFACLEFGMILILVRYVFLARKKLKEAEQNTRYRTQYGFYWDNNANPLCPRCEKPLGVENIGYVAGILSVGAFAPQPKLNCVSCNERFTLVSDIGSPISLSRAKASLPENARGSLLKSNPRLAKPTDDSKPSPIMLARSEESDIDARAVRVASDYNDELDHKQEALTNG